MSRVSARSTMAWMAGAVLVLIMALQPVGAAAGPWETSRSKPTIPAERWSKFHNDLASTGLNANETILSTSTVSDLAMKWIFPLRGAALSSPAVVKGIVYAANLAGRVFAIDAATGVQLWTHPSGKSPADLTVAQGLVFVGTGEVNRLFAFDASTGVLRWYLQAVGGVGFPLVIGNTVYVGTNAGELYALRISDGTVRWESTFDGGVNNGLAAAGSYLYAGDATSGCARAFDQRTGGLKWTTCVGQQIDGTPTVAGGKVFVGARNGNVYALDDQSGAILWTGDTGSDNESSAAAAYGMVYFGSVDTNVYAFPQDCSDPCPPSWTFQTGDAIVGESAVVANGVLYIGSKDDVIYALDAMTGAQLWSYETQGNINDAPAVLNGVLYVGSFDRHLYAFSLSSGS